MTASANKQVDVSQLDALQDGSARAGVAKVDVASVIDHSAINGFRVVLFSLCFLIMMIDGFDTQAVAYVGPSLAAAWKVSPGAMGLFFSAALLGSMIGALLFGYVTDKFGRQRAIAICIALFGILNVASAYSTSIEAFTILRFLCGIGLGGAIPNVLALVTEYAPAKMRATLVAFTMCGIAMGAVLGGLISIPLIATFGWPAVFIFGGVLPLCLLPIVAITLPESIKFLILSNRRGDRVASILAKVDPSGRYSADDAYVLDETKTNRGEFLALFRNGLAVGSVFLAGALFMSLLLVYCFIMWLPLLLRQAGLPLQDAIMGTIVFNLAGMVGSFACTRIIDRNSQYVNAVLIAGYFLGAVVVASIGFVGATFWPIMTAIFLSGFVVIGVQLSLFAAISSYYPTTIRGTGLGWSLMVGRTGSLVGPVVGSALVAQGMSPSQLFQTSSVAPLLACISLIIFAKLSPATTDYDVDTARDAAARGVDAARIVPVAHK
jgi:AAHS family 4-hydroxybenzoate transporter-like MFS transporter